MTVSAASSEPAASGVSEVRMCTWCGLPAAAASGIPTDEPVYCCYGCRFAHSVVKESGTQGAMRWTVLRLGIAIFFTMNLMAFTMAMWSLDVYDVDPDPLQKSVYELFRWAGLFLALPVLFLLGGPLLQRAVLDRTQRAVSADLLIAVAVFAAYGLSAAAVVRGSGPVYFEVGAMVLVMMTLGRWIEATGRHRATELLSQMLNLLPEKVCRIRGAADHRDRAESPEADREEIISAADIRTGDHLRVRPGERFAVDGVIVHGTTAVDEQTFTGESRPQTRSQGDSVLGGTINLDGSVIIRVTAPFQKGAFGRLLETLQEARRTRGRYQRLADRVASWFFPAVTLTAAVTFFVHLDAGGLKAVHASMSVLLIACPCAFGLATPLAVWTALSTAARHQVLFRSGEAIEQLADVQTICMDKTGTLTSGEPQVLRAQFESTGDQVGERAVIRELACASRHPFSQAVARWIREHDDDVPPVGDRIPDIRQVPGCGVEARTANGQRLRLGSPEFVLEVDADAGGQTAANVPAACCAASAGSFPERQAVSTSTERLSCGRTGRESDPVSDVLQKTGHSVVAASRNGRLTAVFVLEERLRDDAASAVAAIGASVDLHILSGDDTERVQKLVAELPRGQISVAGHLKPQDKVQYIRRLRKQHGTVAMVGDGINDAPALAASDVGVAMACGADVSRDSADVCLLSDQLSRIPWAIDLARRTRSVIRQNLAWAFGYNTIGVTAAAAGWLNPAFAAALMIASSLAVISNSFRLLHGRQVDWQQAGGSAGDAR